MVWNNLSSYVMGKEGGVKRPSTPDCGQGDRLSSRHAFFQGQRAHQDWFAVDILGMIPVFLRLPGNR